MRDKLELGTGNMNYDDTDTIIDAVRSLKVANEAVNREQKTEARTTYSAQARFHDCVARVLALKLPPEPQSGPEVVLKWMGFEHSEVGTYWTHPVFGDIHIHWPLSDPNPYPITTDFIIYDLMPRLEKDLGILSFMWEDGMLHLYPSFSQLGPDSYTGVSPDFTEAFLEAAAKAIKDLAPNV